MKNLILSFALVAFVGSISFANSSTLNISDINTELSHNDDDEKCKKGCKKECCTKKEEKKCTKGEKKACCKKSKKSCTKSKEAEAK